MANVKPPMASRGIFYLRAPFEISSRITFHVGAIRSFEELISRGIDPMKLVYEPVGLTAADYSADVQAGADIVTLLSETTKPVYVPTTYIESYPDMGVVPHSHVVLAVSLGILPDTYDTTRAQQAVKQAISDDIGVEPTVYVTVAPTTDVITQAEYVINANIRKDAIKNKTTTYAQLIQARSQVEALKQSQKQLLEVIDSMQNRINELEKK